MKRRILWALNHQTLMPDELSVLRELGFEIFTPRQLPGGAEGRSFRLEAHERWDAGLPAHALTVLCEHRFYERNWSPTVSNIINRFFDVVVTGFYPECFSSAVHEFNGPIVARAFGRERGKTYSNLIKSWGIQTLENSIRSLGDRYIFGQAYDELQEIEAPPHSTRAVTLPLPPPSWVAPRMNSWHGNNRSLLFNCPLVNDESYYKSVYDEIKENFGDLPHIIFGRQVGTVDDPNVISPALDEHVLDLYAGASAFIYTSSEERHLHYSPIEAAMVGTPVLYKKGSLLDRLSGKTLPGSCDNIVEMRQKAESLLDGVTGLRNEIIACQHSLFSSFSRAAALASWKRLLGAALRDTK